MTTEGEHRGIETVIAQLTPESEVTIDRAKGHVLVDDKQVADFGTPPTLGTGPAEDYADTLWTHVEDLKAAKAGWPC